MLLHDGGSSFSEQPHDFMGSRTTVNFQRSEGQPPIRAEYLRKLLNDDQRLPVGDERTRAAKEHSDLMKWFADQHDESKTYFARYFEFG
jgi:hypothetical protein